MRKSLILLAVILVLLTGCADKNVSSTPAPTATQAPTQKPTDAPTATVAPTNTPTVTPEEVAPMLAPTVSKESMDALKGFIGTDTHGDIITKIAESNVDAKFIFDHESTQPWGTITSVENNSGNEVTVMISDGFKYVKSIWNEGMTVDDLAKLVRSGRGLSYSVDDESTKPGGTILSVDKDDSYLLDYSSTILLTISGNGSDWKTIPVYYPDSTYEKDGVEYKHCSDPYGVCELTVTTERSEYYSETKELVTYVITETSNGGIKESLENLQRESSFALDLIGIISNRGYSTREFTQKVYRADNTLQAEFSEDGSMAAGTAYTDNWDLTIYDEKGKNPVSYSGGVGFGDDVKFSRDEYGRYYLIDLSKVLDELNSFVGTVSLGKLLSKIMDYQLTSEVVYNSESTKPWGTIENINISYANDAVYDVTITMSDKDPNADDAITRKYSDDFGIFEITSTENRKDYLTTDGKLEKYEITEKDKISIKEALLNQADQLFTASGNADLVSALLYFDEISTSTTCCTYRANGTLMSKLEAVTSGNSALHAEIFGAYALDGGIGQWCLYTYDEKGENPVQTEKGPVLMDGSYGTYDDIP